MLRLRTLLAFAGATWLAAQAACSSSAGESSGAFASGGSCALPSCAGGSGGFGAADHVALDVDVPDQQPEGGSGVHPLCELGCRLDDPLACQGFDGGAPEAGVPPDAGDAGDAGDAADGDAAAYWIRLPSRWSAAARPAAWTSRRRPAAPASASTSDPNGSGPPKDAGAPPGDSADAAPPPHEAFGCRLTRAADALAASCAAAGNGTSGAPCVGASDCAAGFGCVGDEGGAQCRPFCCAGTTSCSEPQTYCAERTLRDLSGAPVLAPVCVAADGCSLSDPWPCPTGQSCTCQDGTACQVVRPDGTTSCVTPGTGNAGDACPCAWGTVCSVATGKCLKLCSPSAQSSACGDGQCQATAQLPAGWGVCVGTTPDAG